MASSASGCKSFKLRFGAGRIRDPSPDTSPPPSGLLRAVTLLSAVRGGGSVTSYWELLERELRIRQLRAARIKRFREGQRKARKWINFGEIADWCAKEDQSIVPSNEKRATAFDVLASDLLAGEFEDNGRSRVLYLHPASARARMTREWLKDAIDYNYDGTCGRSQYLAPCWIPRRMFERWLARHRLAESPRRFEPLDEQSLRGLKKPKRGRPAEYNWDGVKSRLAGYVLQHGPVQTSDELLQKCADFATELHPDGSTPSDKTIREAIRKYQLEVISGAERRK